MRYRPTDARAEQRAMRAFLLALRSRGVKEPLATLLVQQTIGLYRAAMKRDDVKRAAELVSDERAGILVAQLDAGIKV